MREGMANADDVMWPDPPLAGDEAGTLFGALERQRATFAWKCGGLDAAGMRVSIGASSITLGGLLKHLAKVEEDVFAGKLFGRPRGAPWEAADWKADPEWEWHSAADDTPEELVALWKEAVVRSRALVTEAMADGGLDHLATGIRDPEGNAPSLRRLVADMIEEYGRHVGHADLIRESVDGLVGEGSSAGRNDPLRRLAIRVSAVVADVIRPTSSLPAGSTLGRRPSHHGRAPRGLVVRLGLDGA